jgi:hypothetical protein
MWESLSNIAETTFQDMPPEIAVETNLGIIPEVNVLYKLVEQEKYKTWNDYQRAQAVACLSLCRLRLSDISMREHVLILWITLGNRFMRVQSDDTSYFYNVRVGHWERYGGLLPCYIYAEVKDFLLQVEGIFRCFKGNVARDQTGVLDAIHTVFGKTEFAQQATIFRNASIDNSGNGKLKRTESPRNVAPASVAGPMPYAMPEEAGIENMPPEEHTSGDAQINHWYILTAVSISKVSATIQRELLAKNLIAHFSEWCATPDQRKSGVSYLNYCYHYKSGATPMEFLKAHSAINNIYVGIPHKLQLPRLKMMDRKLLTAIARCQKIYQQTFWANAAALEYVQACVEYAKRGFNINELGIFLGPGGVGLSLFTAHLAAMVGAQNHRYFDPNVFYQDDEMRKIIETLIGAFLFTGQERPTGQKNSMREDLLKKFATAEGIAGRMPYAILTKLIKLIGWKRLEMNKLFQFDGIDDSNFESIVRRCAVIIIKARFFDEAYLASKFGDKEACEKAGVFARDPDAMAFLTGEDGVDAGLLIQHLWGSTKTLDDLRLIMSNYVKCGGDDGATNQMMRQACGLEKDAPGSSSIVTALSANLTDGLASETSGPSSVPGGASALLRHYAPIIINSQSGYLTNLICTRLKMPECKIGKRTRKEIWSQILEDTSNWRIEKRDGGEVRAYPIIKCTKSLTEAIGFDMKCPHKAPFQLNEQWDAKSYEAYNANADDAHGNQDLLLKVVTALAKKDARRPGKLPAEEVTKVTERKYQAKSLKTWNQTASNIDDAVTGLNEGEQTHTRRLRRKTSAVEAERPPSQTSVAGASEPMLERLVTYGYKHPFRTRCHATGTALQGLPQLFQEILSPTTADIDIVNTEFVLVDGLIAKLEVHDRDVWQPYIDIITEVASNRDLVCLSKLNRAVSVGKELLIKTFNGQKPSQQDSAPDSFLKKVHAAGQFFRLLVASILSSDVVHDMNAAKTSDWLEGSCAAHMWFAIEDHIMCTWINSITPTKPAHLSHHYDGLRLDLATIKAYRPTGDNVALADDSQTDVQLFMRRSEQLILDKTGFKVELKNKVHKCLGELLDIHASTTDAPFLIDELLRHGNCIPLAICRLLNLITVTADILEKLNDGMTSSQLDTLSSRSYKFCQRVFCVNLMGSMNMTNLENSEWLIHAAGRKGRPSCMACKFDETGTTATIWNLKVKYTVDWIILQGLFKSAIDGRHISYFLKCGQDFQPVPYQMSLELLDLRAGGDEEDPCNAPDTESMHTRTFVTSNDFVGAHDSEDESVVHVDAILQERLKIEFQGVVDRFHKQKKEKRQTKSIGTPKWVCGICPSYSTNRACYFEAHLERHGAAKHHVLSGFKQLKCIKGLFDNDSIIGTLHDSYLRRSAHAVNVTSVPGVIVDRAIKLVLDACGPRFAPMTSPAGSDELRCVGYTYYTRAFANDLFSNAMYVDGRLMRLRPLFIRRARDHNCELWSLIPRKIDVWAKICEDVFFAPPILKMLTQLLEQCFRFDEFMYLQMDCTVRVAFNIRGQASYRASKEVRNSAAIKDDEALRRVLAVRGRTGAVVHLDLVASEESSKLVGALVSSMNEAHRRQTVIIATDNPSFKLYQDLLLVFVNLIFLLLDPIHLIIVYKQCFYNKVTSGMVVLRVMMNKFNKVDRSKQHTYWGDAHPCEQSQRSDPRLEIMRNKILNNGMAAGTAKKIIQDLDIESPWYTHGEFVRTMVAFSVVYRGEVTRKTHIQGKRLYVILWSATAHDRVQWYFNNIRAKHWMPAKYQSLAASGTSAVESLNHEVNAWLSNMPEVYAATMRLELHINMLKKLMTHNLAMYSPQLRQLSQQTIAAASHSIDRISAVDWDTWCGLQAGRPNRIVEMPLYKAKMDQQEKVLAHERSRKQAHLVMKHCVMKRPGAHSSKTMFVTMKRPAAVMPTTLVNRRVEKKHIKRHAFNLKRVRITNVD